VAVEDGFVIERIRWCGGARDRFCLGLHNRITTPRKGL
jgi:hypothetical protein